MDSSQLYNSTLKGSFKYSMIHRMRELNRPKEEFKPLIEVNENDLLLGCSGPQMSRDNLVRLNLKKFSTSATGEKFTFTGAFLGIQGSGKSNTAEEVFYANFVKRYHEPLFVYDPKGEWWTHGEKSFEGPYEGGVRAKVDQFYSELNVENMGRYAYRQINISPLCLGRDRKNVDVFFAASFPNLKDIHSRDPTEAVKLIAELLGLTGGVDKVEEYLDLIALVMLDKSINTWKEFKNKIREKEKQFNRSAGVILRKLRIRKEMEILSDNPKKHIDILQLMVTYEAVIFRGKLRTSKNPYVDLAFHALLKVMLALILYDCQKWNIDKDNSAVMKKDSVAILLDEVDQLAPDNEETTVREFVTSFATKARQAGIDLGLIGQEASLIYNELFTQCKIIFTSQITENNAKILAKMHVPKEYINMEYGMLSTLRRKVETSCGTVQDEWAVKDEEGNILTYIALPADSRFMRR